MKRFTAIALATLSLAAFAQHKIDVPGRQVVEQYRLQLAGNGNDIPNVAPLSIAATAPQTYGVIVELNDISADLTDVVTEVTSQIGEFVIATVTAPQMEQLAAMPEVKSVSLGHENRPMLNKARAATSVDEVHAGTGLTKGYTGKGVVVGLYDTGLDANHINFKDSDGNLRVKRLWVYDDRGRQTAYTTPDAIAGFTTETTSETHGTHVLGIMAGSYNGPATYAQFNSSNRPELVSQSSANSAVPYYGVAKDADINITCGPLSNANMLAGVESIVNYAKSQGKPCVVNLSVGNNIGPHDGTDAFSAVLDRLGEDAIICVAAGNEGENNISLNTFGQTIKTFVGTTGNNSKANAIVDIWGGDNQIYKVRVFSYDRSTQKEIFSYTLDENLKGSSVKSSSMPGFSSSKLSGEITITSNISTANNRYNVYINPNVTGQTGVLFGIALEPANASHEIDAFVYNAEFLSVSQPGYVDGSPENSINGLACGANIIAVGSFTSSPSFPYVSGNSAGSRAYGGTAGSISSFSSYGWRHNGENLPHVCAPGQVLVSSISEYYRNTHTGELYSGQYVDGSSNLKKRNSSWQGMQGTSMACPFAAGVIGLWLEACPTLTVAQVKDIINETSYMDPFMSFESEKWGAGKIDALEGIKKAIEMSDAGVNDIVSDDREAIVSCTDGRTFDIFVPGATTVKAQMYSLSGSCVAATNAAGNSATLSGANAQPGVYVIAVTTDKGTETIKVTVK